MNFFKQTKISSFIYLALAVFFADHLFAQVTNWQKLQPFKNALSIIQEAQAANREQVVSSGGAAAVNTAITTLAGLGGGVVMLDGEIAWDADVNLAAGVYLAGYGPNTGLVNSSASNYEINIQGTCGSAVGIAAPFRNAEEFTTDTAADAGNFSAVDWAIVKDDTTALRAHQWVKVKTDGVVGTGVVKFFGQFKRDMNAASTATPCPSLMIGTGLMNMKLETTGSGTGRVDIDNAADVLFNSVAFIETGVDVDTAVNVWLYNNNTKVVDNKTMTFLSVVDYVQEIIMNGNEIHDYAFGFDWRSDRFLTQFAITNNRFYAVGTAIYLSTSNALNGNFKDFAINDNQAWAGEVPADGGGDGTFIDGLGVAESGTINDNQTFGDNYNGIDWLVGTTSGHSIKEVVISGNRFMEGGTINLQRLSQCTVSHNSVREAISISRGCTECTILGNVRLTALTVTDSGIDPVTDTTIIGNTVSGTLTIGSASTDVATRVTVSGNKVGALTVEEDGTDLVITGNMIDGNMSIGAGAADVNDRLVITGNNVDGDITFAETAQDYVIIVGNTYNGTLTTLTGTGNQVANNANY